MNSERSAGLHFAFVSAGIKGMCHYAWQDLFIFMCMDISPACIYACVSCGCSTAKARNGHQTLWNSIGSWLLAALYMGTERGPLQEQ